MDSDVTGFPVPDIPTSTRALEDVLDSEDGRNLAENLQRKMEELTERFKSMGPEERAKFQEQLAAKFQGSIEKLKKVVHEKVESSVRTKVYSQMAIQLVGWILLISFIG